MDLVHVGIRSKEVHCVILAWPATAAERYNAQTGVAVIVEHDAGLAQFRDEVREFLTRHFTPELRACARRQAGVHPHPKLAMTWQHILYEKGWITPMWPIEYGGLGWTQAQLRIYQAETSRFGVPILPGMGLRLCGPVILRYGTQAQKDFFLPRIRSGEHYWCQGYSEPGSGSDLASLQTRAVLDGDHYVLTGTKIWTTHAHAANWIFMLVRTKSDGKLQDGISFLVTPMDAPGISVRAIISMSGEHELNQVFFDNVRVPVTHRFGEENAGWDIAKYLLRFERGGSSYEPVLCAFLDSLWQIGCAESADDGGRLIDDVDFGRKLAELEIESLALSCVEQRLLQGVGDADAQSLTSSVKKLVGSTLVQRFTELAMDALGLYAAADQSNFLGDSVDALHPQSIGPDYAVTLTAAYLSKRAITIYGGTSEVQKNILARILLGT